LSVIKRVIGPGKGVTCPWARGGRADDGTWLVQGGVMGYSLVALSMMILYSLALIYREIFSKVRNLLHMHRLLL
jgi:hypothetical protein